MIEAARGSISTILFPDAVGSTVLMRRLVARRQFEELGMTGWPRRAGKAANELRRG
jgi:hypothetical protein